MAIGVARREARRRGERTLRIHLNGAICVNIEGLRPCLSKPSYGVGPNGPPNAKGTASIASEIALLENRAFLVIWVILGKTGNLEILATHFRERMDLPEESSTWSPA